MGEAVVEGVLPGRGQEANGGSDMRHLVSKAAVLVEDSCKVVPIASLVEPGSVSDADCKHPRQ